LPTGGIKTAFHAAQASTGINAAYHPAQVAILEPAEKKTKIEAIPPHVGAKMPPVTNEPMAPGGSGLSSRLGFSYPVAQTVPPQTQSSLAASQNSQLSNQQTTTAGVALPVGVGIRLGGVGGVAPATAAQARPGGQYTMWGGPNAGGVVSEQAVAERRQRNREHAKRSRVRKKFMLESLQEQVMSLQKENVELRMLIQEKIPEHAQQIIAECCNNSTVFTDPGAADSGGDSKSDKDALLDRSDVSLMESLSSSQQNFVLSDPRLPDNPIVYASPGFYKLTGYTQDQVLGRNCRFLQGPGTDPRHIDIIRKAVAIGSDATVCLLNYKADGTPFWNQFFIAALRDSDNCIVNFVSRPFERKMIQMIIIRTDLHIFLCVF
jgi:PAS domain S-box-containing protein